MYYTLNNMLNLLSISYGIIVLNSISNVYNLMKTNFTAKKYHISKRKNKMYMNTF